MEFKGDINNDGRIDELDARICLAALSEALTLNEAETIRADVDNDKKITIADAKAILGHINCEQLIDEIIRIL